VVFFRGLEAQGFPFLPLPVTVDVVTVPEVNPADP
jgi:hypothetical protein